MKKLFMSLVAVGLMIMPSLAQAEPITHNTIAVQGYDLVSYHTGEKPLRGNGNHITTYNDVNYLFVNEANKKAFISNPAKYLPAYGGWCAFGVSVGKKFSADPEKYALVDGRLYLNLDNKIKAMWVKDIPGNIKKANVNWTKIRNKKPSAL